MSADSNSPVQTPGSTSGGSPGTSNPVEHVREQVEDIQLDRDDHAASSVEVPSQQANTQEDTEMVEAAPLPRSSSVPHVTGRDKASANLPLAPESTNVTTPRASSHSPSASSSLVSSAAESSSVGNYADSVKKLVWRRDNLMNLLMDMVEGTDVNNVQGQQHIVEMRTKVENMNKLISTLKQSVKLSEANVTASISGDNEGISLSKQDLPKFQLKSHATRYFPSEVAYDSIHHFLRSFEKVIMSSGKAVEDVWRRYIPLTIPYDLDLWLNQDLLTAKSWSAAKDKFTSKFSNAALRLDARREVQTASMKPGETTEEYYNRFARAMMEAGYSSEDTTLGDTFLLGFPNE
ncbi:unnamed protein product [Mucor circinelloides]